MKRFGWVLALGLNLGACVGSPQSFPLARRSGNLTTDAHTIPTVNRKQVLRSDPF